MEPRMKKRLRMVLAAVFAVSTLLLAGRLLQGAGGEEAYEDALAIAMQNPKPVSAEPKETEPLPTEPREIRWVPAPVEEEDPHLAELAAMDLDALRQINPDVIGWIRIPDTVIDYPLLQGEDNEYYLKHTWEEKKNAVGSIFLECRNSPDLTDYNTIIYGHNMNNGSMFASLRKYAGETYFTQHPYVYLVTDDGVLRYDVFSSYKADVDGVTYGLSFRQEETKAEFLIHALENSSFDAGIVPESQDRILTLSTCSGAGYSTRWVVHARLKMVQEF